MRIQQSITILSIAAYLYTANSVILITRLHQLHTNNLQSPTPFPLSPHEIQPVVIDSVRWCTSSRALQTIICAIYRTLTFDIRKPKVSVSPPTCQLSMIDNPARAAAGSKPWGRQMNEPTMPRVPTQAPICKNCRLWLLSIIWGLLKKNEALLLAQPRTAAKIPKSSLLL